MATSDIAHWIDLESTCRALEANTARLTALLRQDLDPGTPAIGEWNVRDVAAHVTWGIENYARWMRGEDAEDVPDIHGMARWNVEIVRAFPATPLRELADRIDTATTAFTAAARSRGDEARVRWYAGNDIPVPVAACMRLIEAALHGLDIARAAGHRWDIEPNQARTMSYGLAYIAPNFVDPGKLSFDGAIEMRIRGGRTFYFVVAKRRLTIETEPRRAGCHISIDPVTWVLLSTGRTNQWLAGLRGKVVTWGTRPWLGFRLQAATIPG